jgi:hypothetical protein
LSDASKLQQNHFHWAKSWQCLILGGVAYAGNSSFTQVTSQGFPQQGLGMFANPAGA